MTEALTRPLFDNRLVLQSGHEGLQSTPGDVFSAFTDMDTLGRTLGVVSQTGERGLGQVMEGAGVDPQIEDRRAYIEREREIKNIEDAIDYYPEEDRDAAFDYLNTLKEEKQRTYSGYLQQSIDAGAVRSKEDLQEEYGDLGLTFDYAMTDEGAKALAEYKRAEIVRNAIASKSEGGVLSTAAMFGGGLVAMATDPLEVATMFIPVFGAGAKAAAVGRLGQVGGRVALGAAEGAIGQAIIEPAYYALSQQAQLDYDMRDALINVGVGAAFGGALGSVAGVISRVSDAASVRKSDAGMRLFDDAVSQTNAQVALRQFVNDQQVSVAKYQPDFEGMRAELDRLVKIEAEEVKSPLVMMLKKHGGVDPDGLFAAELKNVGIDAQAAPGLYRRGGVKDFDNLPIDEVEEFFGPRVYDIADSTGKYVDPQKLIELVAADRAAGGSPEFVQSQAARAAIEAEIASKSEIWSRAEEFGFEVKSERELNQLAARVADGEDFQEALYDLAVRPPDDMAQDLAKHAEFEPLADVEASQRAEAVDTNLAAEIDDMWAMVGQMVLSDDAAADLADIKAMDARVGKMQEVVEAAAICLARV